MSGRHRGQRPRPTARETFERAMARALFATAAAMILLVAWNSWPTNGTPGPMMEPHFHLRGRP